MEPNQILTEEEKQAISENITDILETDITGSQVQLVDFSQIQNTTQKYPGLQPLLELFIVEFVNQFSKFLHQKVTLTLRNFQFSNFGSYYQGFSESSIYNLLK